MASVTQEKINKTTSNAFLSRAVGEAIAKLYPSQVIYPSSSAFTKTQEVYWNQLQRDNTPACFFQPINEDQVRAGIKEVQRARCTFSIKGGGHSSNLHGSSINGGFQFDLVNLNHVEIADDRQTARVGPGVRWGPFYEALERQGLMAVGGRDAGVGVPGFVFGGGLSNFSAQHGWAHDSLEAVDIVLADGNLITVDKDSHPDLFKALHGGGAHNFGIVTSLTLKLYEYSGMWGGAYATTEEHFHDFFDAYDQYTKALPRDGKAHLILDFARKDNVMLAIAFMAYPGSVQNPPIYDGFRRVPGIVDTLRLADNSNLATEMAEVTYSRGKRNAYWTQAMDYDIDLVKAIYALYVEKSEPFVQEFRMALDFNHITPAMRNRAARRGTGNVYGLEGPDMPLSNVLLTMVWDDASLDDKVFSVLRQLGAEVVALAQQRGKYRPFIYMNYGNQEQDVISSFGRENKEFLIKVASQYDPSGVFQKQQPGAFKLDMHGDDLSPALTGTKL